MSEENRENITLIWFDPVPNGTNDVEKMKEDLRALINFMLCASDIDSCTAYVKSIKKEKIFLIIGGNNAYRLLPNIINLSPLDSVFIFPENSENFGRLYHDFPRVVGIFDNVNDLLKAVKENTRQVNRQLEMASFYDKHQQSTRDLSKRFGGFLW